MFASGLALWATIALCLRASSVVSQVTLLEAPVKLQFTPEQFEKSITLEGLLTHSKQLWNFANLPSPTNEGVTRSFASVGYNASADYVEKLALDNGFEVKRYPALWQKSLIRGSEFSLDGVAFPKGQHLPFQYSPSANITGPLTLISVLGCNPVDWPSIDGKGRVALINRGNCTFAAKMTTAKSLNYSAIIVIDNEPGAMQSVRLGTNFTNNIPSLFLTKDAGTPIVEKLNVTNPPELIVSFSTDVFNAYQSSESVVATSTFGDPDKIIMIGAHLDSVPEGPGINDDGSGTATVAELAIQIAKFGGIKNAVRFAWWTTEEFGLVGSRFYVGNLTAAERAKIVAYINLDMTASPNYIIGVHDGDNSAGQNSGTPATPQSAVIERLYQQWYRANNINYTSYAFGSGSDYRPFIDAGITSGGVATGAGGVKSQTMFQLFGGKAGEPYDSCYHEICDNLDNLAHDAFLWNARSTANIVAQLLLDEQILQSPPPPALLKVAPDEHFADDTKKACGDHGLEI